MSKSKVYKNHYDPTFIMNAKDADGCEPTWRIVCSLERGPGKSFAFSKIMVNNYLDKDEQCVILTRNVGDLGSVAKGIMNGFFEVERPDLSVREVVHQSHVYSDIYLDMKNGDKIESKHIGWVLAIRKYNEIKRISSLFNAVSFIYFDEFQPLDENGYLPNEIEKIYTIYKSIARGGGKAVREVPIVLCSNTISLGNPYFEALQINTHIQSDTKFYQGHNRVVFERCEVEGLKKMHAESGIDVSLRKHLERAHSNVWINDEDSLVAKKRDKESWGRPNYICTLVSDGERFGMYKYDRVGYTFISRTYEEGCKYVYCLKIDGTPNIPVFKASTLMKYLKRDFFKGTVRFSDAQLQKIFMDIFA